MKKVISLASAVCLFMLMCGCSKILPASVEGLFKPSKAEAIPFAEHQLYAVAWVGYDDLTNLPFYLDSYVDSEDLPIHYFSKGEYYLVIPRYADMRLELYQNNLETQTQTLVFAENICQPFLIQCNISDIFPDATISLTYDSQTVTFSPYISLKDGSVQVGESGLNLTQ